MKISTTTGLGFIFELEPHEHDVSIVFIKALLTQCKIQDNLTVEWLDDLCNTLQLQQSLK